MSRVRFVLTAVAVAAFTAGATAQTPAPRPASQSAPKTRVGVFDSRMVALAYYNSEEHRKFMQRLMSEMQTAKKVDDKAKIAELEFQGPALQSLMHYQVFSNASIPNITEKLRDDLTRIAEQQRVVMIVSKWDVAYRHGDVEYVDVTDAIVERFHPTEKVQTWIATGKEKEPMPLLQAVMTLRPER